ncbi:helix-turn-helix transcriptional regulator [Thioclava sp. GXIMD4216]|uniref:Helix-turn-helix transcriptional regulator n=1 Tax=Thioclava litoralis TaxID=3076557 RepID=A0ABZ1E1V4_9RHOB|nr:helix-turn-helix transcriptional regulator [Thioclava sp. FTW29]
MVQLASPAQLMGAPVTRVTSVRPDYWVHLAWITAGATPLCAWRHAANLSTAGLADAVGISPEQLARIECRKEALGSDLRLRAAAALGVPEGDLRE